ncbi:PREDICTED: uncharacterized protein LOC108782403 [Cyphomyrmex costatus]|nr:PREDICTED: uncharacterized protein LOC108782403 [Cyphomyrmex costatus]
MSEIGYICSYCKWVLKKDQITMHSCLNIDNKKEQILVIDSQNRHISIQDIENYELDDIENYTERNEVAKEMSNNDSYSINKQAIDEDLINAVQKRPALYDYRMPLKERSRQKNDLWKKVSKDLNGKIFI